MQVQVKTPLVVVLNEVFKTLTKTQQNFRLTAFNDLSSLKVTLHEFIDFYTKEIQTNYTLTAQNLHFINASLTGLIIELENYKQVTKKALLMTKDLDLKVSESKDLMLKTSNNATILENDLDAFIKDLQQRIDSVLKEIAKYESKQHRIPEEEEEEEKKDDEQKKKDEAKKIETLEQEISQLKTQERTLSDQVRNKKSEVEEKSLEVTTVQNEYDLAIKNLSRQKAEIDEYHSKIEGYEKQIAELKGSEEKEEEKKSDEKKATNYNVIFITNKSKETKEGNKVKKGGYRQEAVTIIDELSSLQMFIDLQKDKVHSIVTVTDKNSYTEQQEVQDLSSFDPYSQNPELKEDLTKFNLQKSLEKAEIQINQNPDLIPILIFLLHGEMVAQTDAINYLRKISQDYTKNHLQKLDESEKQIRQLKVIGIQLTLQKVNSADSNLEIHFKNLIQAGNYPNNESSKVLKTVELEVNGNKTEAFSKSQGYEDLLRDVFRFFREYVRSQDQDQQQQEIKKVNPKEKQIQDLQRQIARDQKIITQLQPLLDSYQKEVNEKELSLIKAQEEFNAAQNELQALQSKLKETSETLKTKKKELLDLLDPPVQPKIKPNEEEIEKKEQIQIITELDAFNELMVAELKKDMLETQARLNQIDDIFANEKEIMGRFDDFATALLILLSQIIELQDIQDKAAIESIITQLKYSFFASSQLQKEIGALGLMRHFDGLML